MKPITIEKIPEGDAAREGARSHQRAGVAGGNVRERGLWLFDRLRDRGGGGSERQRAGALLLRHSHWFSFDNTLYLLWRATNTLRSANGLSPRIHSFNIGTHH